VITLDDVKQIRFVFILKHVQACKSSFLDYRMPEEMGLTSLVCKTVERGKKQLF
jgi:hypothetical protein